MFSLNSMVFVTFCAASQIKYKKTIKFWHHFQHPTELQIVNKYIRKFNESYPEVKVQQLSFDFGNYRSKLFENLKSGNGPDVFIIPNDWLGELLLNNLIKPLIEYQLDPKNLITIAKSHIFINNILYAIPFYCESIALIYNKNLVKTEPPTNINDFLKLLDSLKSKCYPLSVDINSAYYLLPWYFGFNGRLALTPAISANAKTFIETCNFWLDLNYNKKLMFPIEKFDYTKRISLFSANNIAFIIDGPWIIPALKAAKINFGVAKLPFITSTNRSVAPFITGQIYCISNQCKYDEYIEKFLLIISSNEIQTEFARNFGKLPTAKSIYSTINKKDDWLILKFYEQLQNGIPMPSNSQMTLLWSVLSQNNLINVFNRKETPTAFVKKYPDFFK